MRAFDPEPTCATSEWQARGNAFFQGLQERGWSDGRNVRVEYRWGLGDPDRQRKYAAELVVLAPDVILAAGGAALTALQQSTRSVPIVFANVLDPVGAGYVSTLARPGGNATGFASSEFGLSAKLLELLKQVAPQQCGTVFAMTYGNRPPAHAYCSPSCQKAAAMARRDARRIKTYDWRQVRTQSYKPIRRAQRFCGPACAKRHRINKLLGGKHLSEKCRRRLVGCEDCGPDSGHWAASVLRLRRSRAHRTLPFDENAVRYVSMPLS
jgi:hypothetical protein